MKRLIANLAFLFAAIVSFMSCSSYDAIVCDEPTAEMVIQYGTPYYYNGTIIYYVYNNYRYYPHYNGAKWYYYRDRRHIGSHGVRKPNGNHHHSKPGYVKPNRGNGTHGGNHRNGNIGRPSRPHSGGGNRNGRPSTPRRR